MSKTLKQLALNDAELNHRVAKNIVTDSVYYYMSTALHFETLFRALGVEFESFAEFSEHGPALEVCREHLRKFDLPKRASVETKEEIKF
jgi:hypothetical protein